MRLRSSFLAMALTFLALAGTTPAVVARAANIQPD